MTAFARLVVAILLVCPALQFANPASGQAYVLSSGAEGGYYHRVASRVAMLLSQESLIATHLASAGSRDNLAMLADAKSEVNVILAQGDALRFYLDDHPEFAEQVVVLDDLGRECVALITHVAGGISSAADLKTGGFGDLVLPGPGSGAAVTLEYMSRMDSAYRKTLVAQRDPMEAMLQMRIPGQKQIAAVMLVKRPQTLSPELEIVVENQDQFRVAPIRPADVNSGKLPDGSPVYTFEKVQTGAGMNRQIAYDTMCTRALLLTSSNKLSERMRRDLAQILLKWGTLIAPGR